MCALLLFGARSSHAQWERVETTWTDEHGLTSHVLHSSPHPLRFYLDGAERDPNNSLCLGCQVTDNGRKRNLRDYVVDVSQRQLGKAFRRQIIEICCPSATVLRYRGYTYSKLHERIGSSTSTRVRPTKPPIFNGSRTSWNPLPTSTRNYHCSSTLDGLFGTARLFFSR